MLKIIYEFRKGIFFIRLLGILNENNYQENELLLKKIISVNKFKYIVINTNYLEKTDLYGLNFILNIYNKIKEYDCNLVLCDKYQIVKKLYNLNIPNIKSELEVL